MHFFAHKAACFNSGKKFKNPLPFERKFKSGRLSGEKALARLEGTPTFLSLPSSTPSRGPGRGPFGQVWVTPGPRSRDNVHACPLELCGMQPRVTRPALVRSSRSRRRDVSMKGAAFSHQTRRWVRGKVRNIHFPHKKGSRKSDLQHLPREPQGPPYPVRPRPHDRNRSRTPPSHLLDTRSRREEEDRAAQRT